VKRLACASIESQEFKEEWQTVEPCVATSQVAGAGRQPGSVKSIIGAPLRTRERRRGEFGRVSARRQSSTQIALDKRPVLIDGADLWKTALSV
jgi:hypothetical protein